MSDKKLYSFSRLNAWHTCPHSWDITYNKGDRGDDNWMGRAGTFAHELLEGYQNGLHKLDELPSLWKDNYDDAVLCDPNEALPDWEPTRLWGTYFFFKSFKGFKGETIGVEEEVAIEFDTWKLTGWIDRISMIDSEYDITDFKISNPYSGAELKRKLRQLYLYSPHIKQKYGKYPKRLIFHFFRKQIVDKKKNLYGYKKQYHIESFNEDEMNNALKWADDTVKEIESATEYPYMPEGKRGGFFCKSICSHRRSCKYGC